MACKVEAGLLGVQVQGGRKLAAARPSAMDAFSADDHLALICRSVVLIVLLASFLVNNAHSQAVFESSDLPLIIIDTAGQTIRDEPKITATMRVVDNGPGRRNRPNDVANAYEGLVGIEYRGSSSQALFPKKSFAVETRNADGSNRNVSLLGLPTENDWVLYGPYSDKSLLRNVLAFHLATVTGRYASRWRFVELVINGDYRGLYALLERIKRDDDRVAIARLDPTDIGGDAVTGGYIIKIDKSDGAEVGGWYSRYATATDPSRRTFYQYHYPKPSEIGPEQKAYIQSAVDHFEDVIASEDFADPVTGYAGLVDVDALVDYILVNEVSNDVDAYRLSTFLYKDRDSRGGKLVPGPQWDFNIAFGNADYFDGGATSGFRIRYKVPVQDGFHGPFWWTRLLDDSSFVDSLSNRWRALRSGPFATDSLIAFLDATADVAREATSRNFDRWPVLGVWVWPNVVVAGSWEAEMDYLKGWLGTRLQWIDDNIEAIGGTAAGLPHPDDGKTMRLSVHPNPVTDHFEVSVSVPEVRGRIRLRLYDTLGRLVGTIGDLFVDGSGTYTFQGDATFLGGGVYFVRLEGPDASATSKVAVR